MALGSKSGRMVLNTKEATRLERRTLLEFTSGPTAANTEVSGLKTTSKA
jgi:hypothetical protein